jgi:hypothetical protein
LATGRLRQGRRKAAYPTLSKGFAEFRLTTITDQGDINGKTGFWRVGPEDIDYRSQDHSRRKRRDASRMIDRTYNVVSDADDASIDHLRKLMPAGTEAPRPITLLSRGPLSGYVFDRGKKQLYLAATHTSMRYRETSVNCMMSENGRPSPFYRGSRFYKCDLQMQTPFDGSHWVGESFASHDEAAEAYIRRCYEVGLEVIALTEHNFTSKAHIPLLQAKAKQFAHEFGYELVIFPGF